MSRRTLAVAACIWASSAMWTVSQAAGPQDRSATPPSARADAPAANTSDQRAVLQKYCITCHNERTKIAGLMLDKLDVTNVAGGADTWEKVVRKVRVGMMPPQGSPRPDQETRQSLVTFLTSELDRASAANLNPGRGLIHRFNRAEYANAIRDLFGLEVETSSLLPPDDSAYGFDNIADALGVSPVLLERYLVAADRVSALAVGDTDVSLGSETYRVRQDLSQDQHIEGLPLGTVGGTLVRHTFPLDGEYEFQVKLFRTNSSVMRGLEYPQQLEITIDGERIFLATVGGGADFVTLLKDVTAAGDAVDARLKVRVPVKAGQRNVGVAFIYRSAAADTRTLQPFLRSSIDTYDFTGRPHVDTLTIVGPFDGKGPGDTPSRRRIFTCRPPTPAFGESRASLRSAREPASPEAKCARQIITTLARRAFHRSVT